MDVKPKKSPVGIATAPIRLILFVAGSTPRSQRGEASLAAVLCELGERARDFHIEIVDVFKDPKRALRQRILVTPTLVFEAHPDRPLIGDLSELSVVRAMLQSAP